MEEVFYLIFILQGVKYAIDAEKAVEVLWLPECRPVEEAPPYIAGLLNLHGRIIPIIDLHIRFGRTPKPYHITDRVIIAQAGSLGESPHVTSDMQIGLIVNDIVDVFDFAGIIESTPEYGKDLENCDHFVTQIAKLNEEVIMIIDIERLFYCSKNIHQELLEGHNQSKDVDKNILLEQKDDLRQFCREASPEDRKIFEKRAKEIAEVIKNTDREEVISLAVVKLQEEYYGIDLRNVQEFITIKNVMPIPCTPPYIIGDMNLRGDILSIIDIKTILNLPNPKTSALLLPAALAKGVVIRINEITVGLPIDEILDIAYVTSDIISDVPAALNEIDEKYLIGAIKYGNGMLAILDLQKIFSSQAIIVNQEV